LISLGLLSGAIIAYQIILMHILSIVQWHHFAYMIISVALLAFAASGTLLTFIRSWALRNFKKVTILLMLACGLLMTIATPLSQLEGIQFDSYLVFSSNQQLFRLLMTYFIFFLPFLAGALVIGLIFIKEVDRIGKLYFANLLGSGLGGILALGLMWLFLPDELPVLIGIIPVLASIIMFEKSDFLNWWLALVSFILLVLVSVYTPAPILSQFKSLAKTLNLQDSEITWEGNSPYGLLQSAEAPALRFAPGISLSYNGQIPTIEGIYRNGNWFGALKKEINSTSLMKFTTNDFSYRISDPQNILVLNAGTGWDVEHGLLNGVTHVTAVEADPLLPQLLELKQTRWILDDRVNYVESEPRSFLQKDTNSYDLIVLPTLNSFGGNSGLNAIEEQYILTTKALKVMWDKLTPKGILSISVWMDYPSRYPLKVLASLSHILLEQGIENLNEHVAAVKSWGTITFLIKRTPITPDQIQKTIEFCNQMMFDPVLLAGTDFKERSAFNEIQDENFLHYLDNVLEEERGQFINDYEFNIKPATDNRPYFSQFLKLKSIFSLTRSFGNQSLPYFELGYFLVILTFFQMLIAGIFLVILPLLKIGWKGEKSSFTLLYFSAIGVGYMFIEIVFIQRLTLYLGNPIYSATLVISSLLIFSGLGSYQSFKIRSIKALSIILLLVALVILLYSFILTPVFQYTLAYSNFSKLIFLIIFIAPLAYLMGMPFPIGLKYLNQKSEKSIPWAWGINGYFSVVSVVLATILSVEIGFNAVMIFSFIAYLVALATILKIIFKKNIT